MDDPMKVKLYQYGTPAIEGGSIVVQPDAYKESVGNRILISVGITALDDYAGKVVGSATISQEKDWVIAELLFNESELGNLAKQNFLDGHAWPYIFATGIQYDDEDRNLVVKGRITFLTLGLSTNARRWLMAEGQIYGKEDPGGIDKDDKVGKS